MQGNDSRVVNAVPKTRTINGHALSASIKDAIRTVDITVESASTTVALPAGTVSAILVLSVCGVMQNAGVWSLSGNTITFGEQLQAGDIVTVIGFK